MWPRPERDDWPSGASGASGGRMPDLKTRLTDEEERMTEVIGDVLACLAALAVLLVLAFLVAG